MVLHPTTVFDVEMRGTTASFSSKRIAKLHFQVDGIGRRTGRTKKREKDAFRRAAEPEDGADAGAGTLHRALENATDATDGMSSVVRRLFERMKWADEKMGRMEVELEESKQAVEETETKLAHLERDAMREREEWKEREAYLIGKIEKIQTDSVQLQEMLNAEKENTSTVEKARAASVQEVMKVLARLRDMEFNFKEKEMELTKKVDESERLVRTVLTASATVKEIPAGDQRLAKELAALQRASIIAAREHFADLEDMRQRAERAEAEVERLTLHDDGGTNDHVAE